MFVFTVCLCRFLDHTSFSALVHVDTFILCSHKSWRYLNEIYYYYYYVSEEECKTPEIDVMCE